MKRKLNNKLKGLKLKEPNFLGGLTQEEIEEFKYFDNALTLTREYMDFLTSNTAYRIKHSKELRENKIILSSSLPNCLICGIPYKGLIKSKGRCDSHNIPAFVLKNISRDINNNKDVATISIISKNPNFKVYEGVNSCDIFRIICKDCDSNFFSEYENPELLINLNPKDDVSCQRMFQKIALKILLKDLFFYHTTSKHELYFETNDKFTRNKIADSLENELKYKLLYYNKLNYNTGFAVQDKLLPEKLFSSDKKVNYDDIQKISYNDSYLYIGVYPVGNETLVVIFTEDSDQVVYDEYEKFIKNETDNNVLRHLSYMLLKYTEKIFFNPIIFNSKMWSLKDKITADYSYVVLNTDRLINNGDYLRLKNATENTTTNIFNVNKYKKL